MKCLEDIGDKVVEKLGRLDDRLGEFYEYSSKAIKEFAISGRLGKTLYAVEGGLILTTNSICGKWLGEALTLREQGYDPTISYLVTAAPILVSIFTIPAAVSLYRDYKELNRLGTTSNNL